MSDNHSFSAAATRDDAMTAIKRSVVIPVYRNEENIAALVEALKKLNAQSPTPIEVVFVIDGSPDRSGELLFGSRTTFAFPYQIIFHSRNFGAFTAIRTGLEHAKGQSITVMAADLQEPPELILKFCEVLEAGEADVVFGIRAGRDDGWFRDITSHAFWALYRRVVSKDMPRGGVDIFACNRTVLEALLDIHEPNSSLIAQLFWVGFRREFVQYERRRREHGKSAWSFARRLRYMMDSIFSFSDLPILAVLWVGVGGCILSLLFGIIVAAGRLFGLIATPGYAALVVIITFSVSCILAVQGVIGSYLWRTFENTKQRPLRIISRRFDSDANTFRD